MHLKSAHVHAGVHTETFERWGFNFFEKQPVPNCSYIIITINENARNGS